MPSSYRNQSIDLQSKSMDRFLYDNGLRHERVKEALIKVRTYLILLIIANSCVAIGVADLPGLSLTVNQQHNLNVQNDFLNNNNRPMQ